MTSFKLDKRITDLLSSQIPDFIKEDHENFINFMESYFEWLETKKSADTTIDPSDGVFNTSANLLKHEDIDSSVDLFEEHFRKEFLQNIPKTVLCDRKKLLKNIKNFYRARGTEKSYRLLFRILFLDNIDFYYPTVDILRPDSGNWQEDISIRVIIPTFTTPFDVWTEFLDQRVVGKTSGAVGKVKQIKKVSEISNQVYELFFEKNSLVGEFLADEKIGVNRYALNEALILPILTGINLTNPGTGYTLEDKITITTPFNTIQMEAIIREVDSQTGAITKIQISNPSTGFSSSVNDITITFAPKDAPDITAVGTAILGGTFYHTGYYIGSDGFLDDIKKLRDDYFYQEFSYAIKTNIGIGEWRDIIKKLVHPAGTLPFCILTGDLTNKLSQISAKARALYTEIFVNKSPNKDDVLAVTKIEQPSAEIKMIFRDNQYIGMGPTYRSINRDAFKYLPSQFDNGADPNYFLGYANYSLADLADVSLDKIVNHMNERIIIEPVTTTVINSASIISGAVRSSNPANIQNVQIDLRRMLNSPTLDSIDVPKQPYFGGFESMQFYKNNLWIVPKWSYSTDRLIRINAVTNEKTTSNQYTSGYKGGHFYNDRYIWLFPDGSSGVDKIDLESGLRVASIPHNQSSYQSISGCFGGGYGWILPLSNNGQNQNIFKIDPVNDTLQVIPNTETRNYNCYGSSLYDELTDSVWGFPWENDQIIRINATTNEITKYSFTRTNNFAQYIRGIIVGDYIYVVPAQATDVLKIHRITGNITSIPHGLGSLGVVGGCLDKNGVIWMAPGYSSSYAKLDTSTDTITTDTFGKLASFSYTDCCFDSITNKVYFSPYNDRRIMMIDVDTYEKSYIACTSSTGGDPMCGYTQVDPKGDAVWMVPFGPFYYPNNQAYEGDMVYKINTYETIETQLTDEGGFYQFNNVEQGTYKLVCGKNLLNSNPTHYEVDTTEPHLVEADFRLTNDFV